MISILISAITLLSFSAFAEGPLLDCQVVQQVRMHGHPGYVTVGSKEFTQSITKKIKTTEVNDRLTVKTYMQADGLFFLVMSDSELGSSASSKGNVGGQKHGISLSLTDRETSNYLSCEVI